MQMLDWINTIWDYNYWARDKVWACVETISHDDYMQHVEYSIGSVHAQCVHAMWAEALWLARLCDQPRVNFMPEDFENRSAVKQQWDEVQANWLSYLASLTAEELQREFTVFPASGSTSYTHSIGQVLLHVVNHASDHRAQILRLVHDFGGETVAQDMIYYFREKAGL